MSDFPIKQRQKRKHKRQRAGTGYRRTLIEGLSLMDMFERFIAYKKTEGLKERTIDDYVLHFTYFLDYIGEEDVSYEEVTVDLFRDWIGYMRHDMGLSPVTVNIRIRSLRAFVRFCHREGYVKTPIHEDFRPIKTDENEIEAFTPAEVRLLLAAPNLDDYVGFRDFVMMCVLLDSMVRISELLNIKRDNVDLKSGEIKLDAADTKNRKSRIVPISNKTVRLAKEYMDETEDFYSDILFLTYHGKTIKPNSWRERLHIYEEKSGVTGKRVSPHTFRHTGALFYIMNGGDPFSLQKILGHADMSMVRKYVQMTGEDVKKQHNIYSPMKNIRI